MDEDLRKELDEMLLVKSEDEVEETSEETSEEEVVEEETETETKEEETEVEETETEEEVEEESSEEESEEESSEEEEEDELTIANRRIAELELLQDKPEEEDELTKAKKRITELEAKPEEEEEIEITEELEEVDFMGELDMEEVTSSSQAFNKLLNKVYGAGVDQGKSLREGVLKSIPPVIKSVVAQQTTLKDASDTFYNDNPDLDTVDRKRIVGLTAESLLSEHPEYNLEKLFEETEKKVRTTLNLKKKATTRSKEEAPSFSKKTKGKSKLKTKPKLTELQQDLDDMNAVAD